MECAPGHWICSALGSDGVCRDFRTSTRTSAGRRRNAPRFQDFPDRGTRDRGARGRRVPEPRRREPARVRQSGHRNPHGASGAARRVGPRGDSRPRAARGAGRSAGRRELRDGVDRAGRTSRPGSRGPGRVRRERAGDAAPAPGAGRVRRIPPHRRPGAGAVEARRPRPLLDSPPAVLYEVSMRWTGLAVILIISLILAPFAGETQQQAEKVYRIGYLGNASAAAQAKRVESLRASLRDLGYVEGKNIVFEFRWAEWKLDRLPDLAAELVRLKLDVLVTAGTPGALAAKQATTTIPIVMVGIPDPLSTS